MSKHPTSANELRKAFSGYFADRGHTVVPSASLIPHDPTILFTVAGMVPFKPFFTGDEVAPYPRAVSVQKCARAGGKHNDLDDVGRTKRHLVFFEMLGNFSFGDYFKEDSIKWSWDLVTEVFGLDGDKLWITVHESDDEAEQIWRDTVGVRPDRIQRLGDKDNFWQMGETGPCGPCSEIHIDRGAAFGPDGGPLNDPHGDRFLEFWNLVFMQYNQAKDGSRERLPKPSIDTGAGLERILTLLQGVDSVWESDVLAPLVDRAASVTGSKYRPGDYDDRSSFSLRVLAEHARSSTMLVNDGVFPSNENRGYVLRRIVRRALRHGYKLGQTKPFFHRLVPDLVKQMGDAYPELAKNAARVEQVLRQEEERFGETLEHGMKILDSALAALPAAVKGQPATLDGNTLFTLYDTYGFPVDLTADICRERGVEVDQAGFDVAMDRQRDQARAAGKFKMAEGLVYSGAQTVFEGYEHLERKAKVLALYVEGTQVQRVVAGQDAIVVLDSTPFYAESGGQVGDVGFLTSGTTAFKVLDTQKIQPGVFGHHGRVQAGELTVGMPLLATVDAEQRARTIRNHSATHLMHKALREVLGGHVQQRGSLVDGDKTRFDFAHDAPMSDADIQRVEQIVNAEILTNQAANAQVMSYDDAVKGGAMALFGEKYGDTVRVLDIGFSRELCGGTHVSRTGDIGLFKVVSEGGVAAGVRRVEAVTGANALAWVQALNATAQRAASALKTQPADLPERIALLQDQLKSVEKELEQARAKLASSAGNALSDQAVVLSAGVKLLVTPVQGVDPKDLRSMVDQLKDKLKSAVVLLAATSTDGKISVVAGVTADWSGKVKAGDLGGFVAGQIGGKGGGRPDMAMGGGTDAQALPSALAGVKAWVEAKL